MSKSEPYYIVALREPGSHAKAPTYVICKTISVLERDAQAKPAAGRVGDSIATYLDSQFAQDAAVQVYEAIGWNGGKPIFDGSKASALFLGTANEE